MVARKAAEKERAARTARRRKAAAASMAHISRELRPLARAIGRLRPDPDNARVHDERNVDEIRRSLEAYGQQKPIVLRPDGKTVAAGSGTLLAARALGWKWIAAIRFDRNPEIAAAYGLADNRTAELATWDGDALGAILKHYRDTEPDAPAIPGWTADEIALLLPGAQETTEDVTPVRPAKPVSVTGEIYELGPHRLLCGDSTAPEAVSALLGPVVPFLMVTDPPYGVDYDPNWRNEANRWSGSRVKLGASALGQVQNDEQVDWSAAWQLFGGDVAYVWCASWFLPEVMVALAANRLDGRSLIIWAKSTFAISRGHYHWQHEPCLYAVRNGKTARWCGDRKQTTLWNIEKNKTSETGHGTQKPVECMARPMRNHGAKDDIVYDPFLGSGTTIVAAEQTGRVCYAVEIDPGYCDVTRQRYANLVGDPAYSPTGKIDEPSADGVK